MKPDLSNDTPLNVLCAHFANLLRERPIPYMNIEIDDMPECEGFIVTLRIEKTEKIGGTV